MTVGGIDRGEFGMSAAEWTRLVGSGLFLAMTPWVVREVRRKKSSRLELAGFVVMGLGLFAGGGLPVLALSLEGRVSWIHDFYLVGLVLLLFGQWRTRMPRKVDAQQENPRAYDDFSVEV